VDARDISAFTRVLNALCAGMTDSKSLAQFDRYTRGGRRRSWNQARYSSILARCAFGA